jgi:hypothetical protein
MPRRLQVVSASTAADLEKGVRESVDGETARGGRS